MQLLLGFVSICSHDITRDSTGRSNRLCHLVQHQWSQAHTLQCFSYSLVQTDFNYSSNETPTSSFQDSLHIFQISVSSSRQFPSFLSQCNFIAFSYYIQGGKQPGTLVFCRYVKGFIPLSSSAYQHLPRFHFDLGLDPCVPYKSSRSPIQNPLRSVPKTSGS